MKKDHPESNKPSTSQASQASQEQQKMSNSAPQKNSVGSQQQGSTEQSSKGQQQSDSGHSDKPQISPSRDQGHTPSGSANAAGYHDRSESSTPKAGKKG
jgi:hypothetical protein